MAVTREELNKKLGRELTDREWNSYLNLERATDEYMCASLSATLDADIQYFNEDTVTVNGQKMDPNTFNEWIIARGVEKGLIKSEDADKLRKDGVDNMSFIQRNFKAGTPQEEKTEDKEEDKYFNNTCGEA